MDQLDQLGKKVAMDVLGTWVINRLPLPYVSISVVVYFTNILFYQYSVSIYTLTRNWLVHEPPTPPGV